MELFMQDTGYFLKLQMNFSHLLVYEQQVPPQKKISPLFVIQINYTSFHTQTYRQGQKVSGYLSSVCHLNHKSPITSFHSEKYIWAERCV